MDAINDLVSFRRDDKPGVDLKNFWAPEDGFAWSTGTWCEIAFDLTRSNPAVSQIVEIELELDVFKAPPDLEGQNIFFYVNGLRLASRFITGRLMVLLEVPANTLRPADNLITIDTPDSARPSDYGESDTRRLGVQLYSLQLRGV